MQIVDKQINMSRINLAGSQLMIPTEGSTIRKRSLGRTQPSQLSTANQNLNLSQILSQTLSVQKTPKQQQSTITVRPLTPHRQLNILRPNTSERKTVSQEKSTFKNGQMIAQQVVNISDFLNKSKGSQRYRKPQPPPDLNIQMVNGKLWTRIQNKRGSTIEVNDQSKEDYQLTPFLERVLAQNQTPSHAATSITPFTFFANIGGKQANGHNFNQTSNIPLQQEKLPSKQTVTIITDAHVDEHQFDIRLKKQVMRNLYRNAATIPIKSNEKRKVLIIRDGPQPEQRMPSERELSQSQRRFVQMREIQSRIALKLEGGEQMLEEEIPLKVKIRKDIARRAQSACGYQRPLKNDMVDSSFKVQMVQVVENGASTLRSVESEIINNEEERLMLRQIKASFIKEQRNQLQEVDHQRPRSSISPSKPLKTTFASRLMNTQPIIESQQTFESNAKDIPYAEVFDRSGRTFAATFAKFGDLSYYTPVQRIGCYMDYIARLKKKHILDLIAYMKTAQKSSHAGSLIEDEESKRVNYLDHTLFLGLMQDEDSGPYEHYLQLTESEQIYENQQSTVRVYDIQDLSLNTQFEFKRIWSQPLIQQAQLSITRFLKYVDSQDLIKNEEITKFNSQWMASTLEKIPEHLLQAYVGVTKKLFNEVFTSYARSMRQAIMEYILLSPQERKRLHIVMLPNLLPTACQRSLLTGGFQLNKFKGQHNRKLDAEQDIKLRLLINNVVTSSLQSWSHDFHKIDLVDFRGMQKFTKREDAEETKKSKHLRVASKVSNAVLGQETTQGIELEDFFKYLEAYRQKSIALYKNIWHRGFITIVKKFKVLKPKNLDNGLWSFGGFIPSCISKTVIENRSEQKQLRIQRFEKHSFGPQTIYQRYVSRAALTLLTDRLPSMLFENTVKECQEELDRIPDLFYESQELENLADIRNCSQYRAFVAAIGGQCNIQENGYNILAKQYKRELKYASGNLMKLHLREVVMRSIETYINYFRGFPTLSQLRSSLVGTPVRQLRISVTQALNVDLEKLEKEQNTSTQKGRQSHNKQVKTTPQPIQISPFDQPPILNLPGELFFDLQDYMLPIIKLELKLNEKLALSHSLQDIQSLIEQSIDRIIESFNDFARPEFCSVEVISQRQYDAEREEANKMKQFHEKNANAHQKQSSSGLRSRTLNSRVSQNSENTNKNFTSDADQQQQFKEKQLSPKWNNLDAQPYANDIERRLYNQNQDVMRDGRNVYKRYFGRIRINESEKDTKIIVDEKGLGVYSRPFVEKEIKVASAKEQVFMEAKTKVKNIINQHYQDALLSFEIYNQFHSIIDGSLKKRIQQCLETKQNLNKPEAHFEEIIKEIKFYRRLSQQLPNTVYFPMFEVSLAKVNALISTTLLNLQNTFFNKFESMLSQSCQLIVHRYTEVSLFISREVKTAKECVEMEFYKTNLILEMTSLINRIEQNRNLIFFLIRNDFFFEESTQQLIQNLHDWPSLLSQLLEEAEDRHLKNRDDLENQLITRRDQLEMDVHKVIEEQIRVIPNYGDLYAFRQVNPKIQDINSKMKDFETIMVELAKEEMHLFGQKSTYSYIADGLELFAPYRDFWTQASEFIVKKRQWFEGMLLSDIDTSTVQSLFKQTLEVLDEFQQNTKQTSKTQKLISQLSSEIAELNEYLPSILILSRTDSITLEMWDIVKKITQTKFQPECLTIKDLKYLGIKEHLEEIVSAFDQIQKQ